MRQQAVAEESHQTGVITAQGRDEAACHVDGVVPGARVRAAQLLGEQSRPVFDTRAQGRMEGHQQRGGGSVDAALPFEVGEGGGDVPGDVRIGFGLGLARTRA
ncbi:hypothetical protein [Streptomyces sp. NPDC001933]|uniref:hypothetical protein n=1 Tax=Streptomyces sp. NPDC001933 TaxID=3364626 RepID=UPI0036B542A0